MTSKPKTERERLMRDIEQAQERLREAEAEAQKVQARGPLVRRLVTDLQARRKDNHIGRDFQITLVPRR